MEADAREHAVRGGAFADLLDYRAPWWLPGQHAQTIYPALWVPRPSVRFARDVWLAPDGDCIAVDSCGLSTRDTADLSADIPTVLLLHGLEGSSRSHYALGLMGAVTERGWRGMVVHWRGCGGVLNKAPRAYHSGDSDEADWIIRRARDQVKGPLYVVGVSLGGNVLLKWLGERGDEAERLVAGAAAVSVPYDLAVGARMLELGFGRIYARFFLRTMIPKALAMLAAHPGLFDADQLRRARTLREFDDVFTAPLHGFRDAADYYARASSKSFLPGIRVPTLLVSASNDPFLPGRYLPEADLISNTTRAVFPESGGHAGFCSGPPPGRFQWVPAALIHFFSHSASAHHAATERNL